MLFPGMNEYQFAQFFVVVKQEEIKKELHIKQLYMDMVIKTVYDFVLNNKSYMENKFTSAYGTLADDDFFIEIINELKQAKENGIPLSINMKK